MEYTSLTLYFDVNQAIDYALDKKIRISNNSYGKKGSSFRPLREAVKRAQQEGMIFVTSAGNSASDNDVGSSSTFPASWDFDNIISVAAVDQHGNLAKFSNWGKRSVDLGAPGDKVLAPTVGGGIIYVTVTI